MARRRQPRLSSLTRSLAAKYFTGVVDHTGRVPERAVYAGPPGRESDALLKVEWLKGVPAGSVVV